jgi:hypothetical protein
MVAVPGWVPAQVEELDRAHDIFDAPSWFLARDQSQV